MAKPLRHQFVATGKTEQCGRCGVERSRSKGLPEYRLPSGTEGDRVLKAGTWSFADPGCRDPRQSDLFAPDLSLPEGFVPIEKSAPAKTTIAIVASPKEELETRIANIFVKTQTIESDDDRPMTVDDILSMFPDSKIVREEDPEFMPTDGHHASIEYGHPESCAVVSLTLDPEGKHLGHYERWHVFAYSPRPLPKGLEQIVEGTLGNAIQKSEWMKRVLIFRPEAILVIDGRRKRIEMRQHPATKSSKAFWSIHEIQKMREQEVEAP